MKYEVALFYRIAVDADNPHGAMARTMQFYPTQGLERTNVAQMDDLVIETLPAPQWESKRNLPEPEDAREETPRPST